MTGVFYIVAAVLVLRTLTVGLTGVILIWSDAASLE